MLASQVRAMNSYQTGRTSQCLGPGATEVQKNILADRSIRMPKK